jgi:hypothetical protein
MMEFSYGERVIVDTGALSFDRDKVEINYSDVATAIVRAVGTMVEHWASDVFTWFEYIRDSLPNYVRDSEEHTWTLGLYKDGVDCSTSSRELNVFDHKYRRVYTLTVGGYKDTYHREFSLTLKRVG